MILSDVDVKYIRLEPGSALPQISVPGPFRAIFIAEENVSQEWRTTVSEWLVSLGCLYFVAWGEDCEEWHDAVDRANITVFENREIPDESFVMTTCHDDESLEEVFWFLKFCAHHMEVELDHALIVHVSKSDRDEEFIEILNAVE